MISLFSKCGAGKSNTSLIETVVFSGTFSLGDEIHRKEQLSAGGIQVHWQSHHVLRLVRAISSINKNKYTVRV